MIKLTYKSKNRNKTTEKQVSPSVQLETETLVEAVLSASLRGRRSWSVTDLIAIVFCGPIAAFPS